MLSVRQAGKPTAVRFDDPFDDPLDDPFDDPFARRQPP
jgi:hypothetical protein